MSVSVKTSHLAPARFSKISFGLTETHPRGKLYIKKVAWQGTEEYRA